MPGDNTVRIHQTPLNPQEAGWLRESKLLLVSTYKGLMLVECKVCDLTTTLELEDFLWTCGHCNPQDDRKREEGRIHRKGSLL